MSLITIVSRILTGNIWQGKTPPTLLGFPDIPYMSSDGILTVSGHPNDSYGLLTPVYGVCSLDEDGNLVIPQVQLHSTIDSIDHPEATWSFWLRWFMDFGLTVAPFSVFGSAIPIPSSPIMTSWESLVGILPIPDPTTLSLSSAGSNNASVAFTHALNAVSYKFERKQGSSGSYSEIATGVTVSPFTDIVPIPDLTYFYRARASNSSGDSVYSNELRVDLGE